MPDDLKIRANHDGQRSRLIIGRLVPKHIACRRESPDMWDMNGEASKVSEPSNSGADGLRAPLHYFFTNGS